MAFAAMHLLAAIGATLFATTGGFHRLTVDAGCRRCRSPAGLLAHLWSQRVQEAVPSAIGLPVAEVLVAGTPVREVVRQGTPGAALAIEVQEAVDDFAHFDLAVASPGLGRRDQ